MMVVVVASSVISFVLEKKKNTGGGSTTLLVSFFNLLPFLPLCFSFFLLSPLCPFLSLCFFSVFFSFLPLSSVRFLLPLLLVLLLLG
jgi:hypothetical protein